VGPRWREIGRRIASGARATNRSDGGQREKVDGSSIARESHPPGGRVCKSTAHRSKHV